MLSRTQRRTAGVPFFKLRSRSHSCSDLFTDRRPPIRRCEPRGPWTSGEIAADLFYIFDCITQMEDTSMKISVDQLTSERIFSRCATLGKERGNCLGIRLRKARSISWILFVAPKTKIRSEPEGRPSHSLRSLLRRTYSKIPVLWKKTSVDDPRHKICFHHCSGPSQIIVDVDSVLFCSSTWKCWSTAGIHQYHHLPPINRRKPPFPNGPRSLFWKCQ